MTGHYRSRRGRPDHDVMSGQSSSGWPVRNRRLHIAWLLAPSGLLAHWVMAGFATLAGGYALSSVLGGQEGLVPASSSCGRP